MKIKKIWNRTKPTASPTKETHPRILKKKKKTNTKSEIKLTHRTHGHVATENTEKTNPQYTETVYTNYNLQSRSKTVFIKKKKPQYRASVPKRQNQTKKTPILAPRRHRHSLPIVVIAVARPSSSSPELAPHRRS